MIGSKINCEFPRSRVISTGAEVIMNIITKAEDELLRRPVILAWNAGIEQQSIPKMRKHTRLTWLSGKS
jgi:hypothetical protein